MIYALDTNTVVYYFKGMGKVHERLLATRPAEIAIPSLVVFELEVGMGKLTGPGQRRSQLQAFLSQANILPFHIKEAEAAARVKVALQALGTPIGPMDTLIAGTALANSAVLVTRNVSEFGRVPGLRVVNWFD